MPDLDQDVVRAELAKIRDAQSDTDIVSAGRVEGLVVKDGAVGFALNVPPEAPQTWEKVRAAAEDAVQKLPGVTSVRAVLTAHRDGPPQRGANDGGADTMTAARAKSAAQNLPGLQDVATIVAVASGKGGVGKSTLSVNLAASFAAMGLRTAILDADIYGPSIPRMLGLKGSPTQEGKRLLPMEAHGLKAMSIGFLVDEETPMIWRGPMVVRALMQLLGDVAWGACDVMVIDLPPGTGDTQLTLVQRVPLSGGIIISTPQEIALIDARKGLEMFKKTEVPILGLVENMSYFVAPGTEEKTYPFGEGGVRRTAETLGYPLLGEIPLYPEIGTAADGGRPIVASAPESPGARAFMDIAGTAWERLADLQGATKPAPRIIFES